MPIRSTIDHVAVAVNSIEQAGHRWADELGGVWWTRSPDRGGFVSQQLRFGNDARLELVEPSREMPENFVRRFLDRFGPRPHHVTLKVPDIHAAIDELGDAGVELVDVSTDRPEWQEAFVRPSQVGGLIVQVAATTLTDLEWARAQGVDPQPSLDGAATFLGLVLEHPDLDRAESLWTTLGASVSQAGEELVCGWADAPLRVWLAPGATARPRALRFADVTPMPYEPTFGAAVEAR